MPVVELSYSRLGRLVGAPKGQISESLPFLGLDIESEDGDLVRVEYSPNRPDYSTDYGIALGMQGLLGIRTGAVRLGIKRSGEFSIRVRQDVSKIRPFVTGIVARGRRIDERMIRQLMAMQEDLHSGMGRRRTRSSIGIHDLDKIAFPLTYAASEKSHSFVPLHSQKRLSVSEILDTDIGREYGHILADHARVPVISDAHGQTVSLPPIINADATTVTTRTRNLFVEVTGTGKADAEDMLSIVATVLQAAGFALYEVRISGSGNSTPKLKPREMALSPALVNRTLGLDLSVSRIVSCLKKSRLGASARGGRITCVIPPHRFDIFGPMDLVEEAALGYGIQNLEPVLSPSQTIGSPSPASRHLDSLGSAMTGMGYMEAQSSTLTSRRILYEMMQRTPKDEISVADSKSREHTVLRDSVLPGLVECLSRNIHEPYPQRLYETGHVFAGRPISERLSMAGVCAHQDASFTEIKSVLQSGLRVGLGLEVRTGAASHPAFADGRCARVLLDGRQVGIAGEIAHKVAANYKIRVPVAGFEVSLSECLKSL